MGYTYRNNGKIQDYWPDETTSSFFIVEEAPLAEILDRAKDKWGKDIDLDCLIIESKYIHTTCLTYDVYDPCDHTEFLEISYGI